MGLDRNSLNSVSRTYVHDDPHTLLILPFHTTEQQTTLSAATVIGDYTFTVSNPTGFAVGKYILAFSSVTNRYYTGIVLGVAGSVISVDSPIDSVFPIGANIDVGSTNMAVNGSVTPVSFGVRSPTPGIAAIADLTRIMIQITTDAAPDFGKFGDIVDGLTNGVVLRFKNGEYKNIFNVKKNSEFANLAYDYTVYDRSNPVVGVYGIGVRLTFSGQEKMGSVIRVGPGEDIEVIIQDDLSTLLSFNIIAQGHIAEIEG